MHGPGQGTAYFVKGSVDPTDLAIDGGTPASLLVISAPVAKPALIGGVGVNGSLAALIGVSTTLNGNSEVSGSIATVVLGDNASTANTFSIDDAAVPARFLLHRADGLSIKSAGTIQAITAKSWGVPTGGVAGTITAAKLLALIDSGDLAASLNVAGLLGPVIALGQISGTWTIGGSATNIIASRGTAADWIANVAGSLGGLSGSSLAGSLTVGGSVRTVRASDNLSTALNAAAITSVSAKTMSGNITASGTIAVVSVATTMSANLTAASIGTLSAGGAVRNSQVRVSNSINVVAVGSIAESNVFAGVAANVSTLPISAADLINPAGQILVFTTRLAGGFSNTAIAAKTLGTVSIHGATAASAGGAAATNFGTFLFIQAGHRPVVFTTRKASPTVPTLLGTDFLIRVL
jgi:hypothetical protein